MGNSYLHQHKNTSFTLGYRESGRQAPYAIDGTAIDVLILLGPGNSQSIHCNDLSNY